MESVLHEAGHCGKFQICHVALVQLCRFVSAWAFSMMVFGLFNPGWRCVYNSNSSDLRREDVYKIYISSEPGNKEALSLNSSLLAPLDVTVDPTSPLTNSTMLLRDLSESQKVTFSFYNGTCDIIKSCDSIHHDPASTTIVSEFDLICDKVWIAYTIVSVLNAGMLVGAFFWGQIGERFGRKICLYTSTFIMTVSCGLAVLSPRWEVYAMFNFFIGFGVVSIIPTVSVFCMEFLTSDWRAKVTAIPVWNAGVICFALLTFILRDWKKIHIATAFGGGIACLGFFWTPESLRWLLIHGKTSEAEQVVLKISKINKKHVRQETLKDLLENNDKDEMNRHYTYLDLFKTRDIRVLTIKLSLIRVVSMLVYDIIGYGIQSLPGDFYTNIIVASVIEVPASFAIGLLANKIGRRKSAVSFISTGAICSIIIVTSLLVLEEGGTRGLLVTSLALINRSVIQAIINLMMTYTAELLPTAVRNVSFGLLNTLGRVTGVLGPYLLPRDYPTMVICFSVLMVSQMVASGVIFSLPETKDRPMEDIITNVNIRKPEGDTN